MSFSLTEKDLDFSKWKVADLKKELKNRGLSCEGKKNELVERLQLAVGDAALLDDAPTDHDDILDEDVLSDEEALDDSELKSDTPEKKEEKGGPVTTGLKRAASKANNNTGSKQAKKITLNRNLVVVDKEETKIEGKENEEHKEEATDKPSIVKVGALTEKERLEKRAAKFGVPMSSDAKKEARAARFGLPTADSKIGGLVNTNVDVLKKRAERFGTTIPGSILEKAELEERRKKRMERFGSAEETATSNPVSKTAIKTASVDEKKRLRAERFKTSL